MKKDGSSLQDHTFYYYLFCVGNGELYGLSLYNATNVDFGSIEAIRPVIEIDLSNVNIGITGAGTNTDPYSITAR